MALATNFLFFLAQAAWGAPQNAKQLPLNLAFGKPASASATQDGHPSEHAVDGLRDTRWCAANDQPGYSWQVDLEKPEDLAGCRILWESEGVRYRYRVEGSADGQAWRTLVDQTDSEATDPLHEHKLDAKQVRYLRLTTTELRGGWMSFWEFQVWGDKQVLATAANAALAPAQLKPSSAEGLLAGVKVPAGLRATLFAAPPEVSYPVCLCAAPTGEVFVGIDYNGSLGAKPERGKIVRCVDTDGDGRMDRMTEFARLDSPRGMVYVDGVLYVQHPPFVRAYYDDDRDGVADREKVLVEGLGFDLKFRGADHTTNGMQLGIDGWLYIAVGDYGFVKATGSDGRELQMRGGGVVRLRPDGSELEFVSRGQRNIYDVAIDPQLNLFTRDNTNDGGGWNVRLSHVVPSGHYGYPSLFKNFDDEIIQPLADYGGGSPTGSLYIDEPGLPDPWGRGLFTCEWGRNGVMHHPLSPRGAGFAAEQTTFIQLPRPTDMDIDGSGRIYVASWRNGGFDFKDPNVGYVIQIAPADAAGEATAIAPFPNLRDADEAALVEYMRSASHVRRLHTQHEILRRGESPSLIAGLEGVARGKHSTPVRVAAIFTLKQLRGAASHPLLVELTGDATVRETALKALADRRGQTDDVPSEPFVAGLKDSDPRVRLQAALGIGRLGRQQMGESLVSLVADPDPLVSHVAIRTLIGLGASEPCLAVLESDRQELLPGALRVLQELHEPAVVERLVTELKNSKSADATRAIFTALCRLHYREKEWDGRWWGTRPDTSGPYFQHAEWEQTPRIAAALAAALEATTDGASQAALLVELKRHKIQLAGGSERLIELARSDASLRGTALELLSQQSQVPEAAIELLAEIAVDSKTESALRAKAVEILARMKSARALEATVDVLATLTDKQMADAALRRASDTFLRDGQRGEQVDFFAKLASDASAPRREMGYAVLLIVADNNRAKADQRAKANRVLDRAWADEVSAISLLRAIARTGSESLAFQVRAHRKDERPQVAAAAERAASELQLDQFDTAGQPTIGGLSPEEALAAAMEAQGDAKLGAKIFLRAGCVACHTTSPGEPPRGPPLGGIAKRYDRRELTLSILTPSAKIAQGFETQWFLTDQGKVFEGFVVREAGDEVELRDVQGVARVIAKDDVDERGRREVSIMPQGIVDRFTPRHLAALVAYLQTLKKDK
jgi:putative membrane-bound dehydrogenase-like protein